MSQFETNESQIREPDFSLSDVSRTGTEEHQLERDVHLMPIFCRSCYKGSNVGKLIRPCRCTGISEFIHTHCLEILVNSWNFSYCVVCNIPFPVERKNKSLLQWCRNREALRKMLRGIGGALSKMLGLLLYNVILITIIHTIIMVLDFSKPAQFIPLLSVVFVLFGALLFPISKEVFLIHTCIIRLYTSCISWKMSNQEMRVITALPDLNQEVIP